MEQFAILAGLAFTVVEFLKPLYDRENHRFDWDRVVAMGTGIALSSLTGVDFLSAVGVTFVVPYAGVILSGVLIGGAIGAGFIHSVPDWVLKALGKLPAEH